MKNKNTAYFVRCPSTIEELKKAHLIERERSYEVAKEVILSAIDYNNFITDMVADRRFLEDNAALCSEGETMKCLFVHQRGKQDGVLAVPAPKHTCFVKWAAFVTKAE